MVNGFRFGSGATWDYGIKVQHAPAQHAPVRKIQTVTVPGRNGDLHFQEDAFHNYTQSYQCYYHSDLPTPAQGHAIKSWLMSSGAYQRLEDTYDPDHFRLATFAGPLDIDNRLNRYGVCTVSFDCDPRSFLKSGEQEVVFSEDGTIYNPTAFNAKPLIYVYGTDAGVLTIGKYAVEILDMKEDLMLDCELQNASTSNGDFNFNSSIWAIPFPEIIPGENSITISGGIQSIKIVPRWWEL